MQHANRVLLLLLLLLSLTLLACGDDEDDNGNDDSPAATAEVDAPDADEPAPDEAAPAEGPFVLTRGTLTLQFDTLPDGWSVVGGNMLTNDVVEVIPLIVVGSEDASDADQLARLAGETGEIREIDGVSLAIRFNDSNVEMWVPLETSVDLIRYLVRADTIDDNVRAAVDELATIAATATVQLATE